MKYRKKPVVIDAVQWTGLNHREMFDFLTSDTFVNETMSVNGDHFYTADLSERSNIIAHQEWGYAYEGEAYKVSLIAQYGMSTPVHRFLNASNGTHFYTSSENERVDIIANLPNYRYEGVSWYI
jgi:hypothetical protein